MPNTMVICIGWLLDFHWPAMCDCKFHTAWWSTLDVSSRGDDLMRDPKMSSSHLTSPNHIGSTCHVKINGRTVCKAGHDGNLPGNAVDFAVAAASGVNPVGDSFGFRIVLTGFF